MDYLLQFRREDFVLKIVGFIQHLEILQLTDVSKFARNLILLMIVQINVYYNAQTILIILQILQHVHVFQLVLGVLIGEPLQKILIELVSPNVHQDILLKTVLELVYNNAQQMNMQIQSFRYV